MRPRELVACAVLAAALLTGCQNVMWYGHDAARSMPVEILSRCGEQFVVAAGREHPSFEAVAIETLAVSPGGRVAYAAMDAGAWAIVIDGRAVGPSLERVGSVEWSTDGETLVAVVGDARGDRVVTVGRGGNWTDHRSFDDIVAGSIKTNEGGALAYVARRLKISHVVLNGEPGPGFDAIARLSLSADGQPSYAARRAEGSWVVRRGDLKGPYEDVADIVSDAAASRVVALVRKGGAWYAEDGLWSSQAYDRIGDVTISERSARVAFRAARGDAEVVVLDGVELGPFAAVHPGTIMLGGPSDRFVFAAREGASERVFIDGVAGDPWKSVEEVVVGGDGRVGYVATTDLGHVVVVDGKQHGAWAWAGDLRMSARGGAVFIARDGGRDVVVDGRDRFTFDEVVRGTLRFGSDGRTWGVAAALDGKLVVGTAASARPVDVEEIAGEVLRRRDPKAFERMLGGLIHAETEPGARHSPE